MKNMKKFLKSAICGAISFALFSGFGAVSAKNLTLVLDPGHGGVHPGCVYSYDGKQILEKDLNLKIAKYLKKELEQYKTKKGDKVVVHLTRNDDSDGPDLEGRVVLAKNKKANALISLHNNATFNKDTHGCMILVTHSNFNKLYKKEHDLARSIIKELNDIGIETATIPNATGKNAGLLRKLSDDGSTYENGDTTDWYGIIRHGINHKVPSVLVEHAYLSNERDYRKFLSTDEKLKKLAIADAKGIAEHYKLQLKNSGKKETVDKQKKVTAESKKKSSDDQIQEKSDEEKDNSNETNKNYDEKESTEKVIDIEKIA